MIFILDRHEKVQAIFTNNGSPDSCPYYEDVMKEDISTGVATYEFKIPSYHEQADLVQEGGYVIRQDLDGKLRMFTIMQVEETHADQSEKYIYAEDAGLELLNDIVRPNKFKSVNIEQALDIVLQDTRWKRGETEYLGVKNIEFQDYQNVVSTLQYLTTVYGGEFSFRVEMENGEIVGRYVDFVKQRGNDTKKRFVFNKDIENIKRTVDMTDLVTALIGIGSGDSDGNYTTFKDIGYYKSNGDPFTKPYNQDWVGDPDALQRYGVQGKHLFGVFQYETTNPEDLLKATWDELQKRKEPKITYELDVALLERLAGLEHEKVRIGDTVYVIDETFSPPLYLEARVMQLETSFSDPSKDKCTLGNFKAVQSNITAQMRALQSKLLKKETTWDEAKNKAEEAFATASEAKSTAETANQTATSAQQTALNAQQTASTAEQAANNASQVASNAEQTAEAAQQTAQQAEQTANEAESAAAQAQQTATIALQTADGKNTNYYGPVDPVNPKSGDAWFVTDSSTGKVIAIRHWNGTEWVDDIDNEAINTAISQAQQDATAAIQQAQDAVNRADQVTQDVQSAINQAQQSLDTAQNALTTAQNALDATNVLSQRVDTNSGDISTLYQTTSSLGSRITDAEGKISTLQQTSDSLVDRISDAEGNISTLTQTAQGLQMNISDLQGDINTLTQTANSLMSQIGAKADQSWVSTQLSQLADDINLRVQKGEIINQINISTEGILIDGRKVHITNETTIDNAVIKDAMIESVSASKISATSLSAISANLGNVKAGTLTGVQINSSSFHASGGWGEISIEDGHIEFSGTIPTGNPIGSDWADFTVSATLDGSQGLTGGATNGVRRHNYSLSSYGIKASMGGGLGAFVGFSITNIDDVGNEKVVFQSEEDIKPLEIDFASVTIKSALNADNFVFTDAIENNPNGSGVNIYIRPKNEMRVTAPGSTTSYLPLRASNVYSNSVDINDLNSGVNLYLRPQSGGEVRVTVTGTTTTYAPMRAKEYNPPNSLREMKKNIEEFTDDVLDTFRNIKTYTFNYNFEEDGAKKTLGLMLDEAPEIIWNASGDSINMYSSIGYLFTGLKQTVAKLDEYKAAIEDLETRLSVVENKTA